MKLNVDKLYNLSYIIRYSNVPRIKNESVSEHSFFVSVEILNLYSLYEFDLGKAISMAITHDFLESEVDDVNHYIKRKYPLIKKAIKDAEEQELSNYPQFIIDLINEYRNGESVESKIVKLADTIQCSTYSKHEMNLGNHGYMKEVNTKSNERAAELKMLLSSQLRKEELR